MVRCAVQLTVIADLCSNGWPIWFRDLIPRLRLTNKLPL